MPSPKIATHLLQGQREMIRPALDNLAIVEDGAAGDVSMCTNTPTLVIPPRGTADNDGTCEDPAVCAHDVESWARHAFAASGFGDVATAAWPTSYEVHPAADARRPRALGAIIAAAAGMVRTIAGRVAAWQQQRQQSKAMYDALRDLDDHMLRDIGFDRGESAALAGLDMHARVLTSWASQGPPK